MQHGLEPTFARLGGDARPEAVLDLKVCDPAMGSGAFLVEACRALGQRALEEHRRGEARDAASNERLVSE